MRVASFNYSPRLAGFYPQEIRGESAPLRVYRFETVVEANRGQSVYNALHIMRYVIFYLKMIQSFKDAGTKELFETGTNRRWVTIQAVALRKLDQIEAAINLNNLRVPPGNRLEPLKGDRIGQHSIRINDRYRICFAWKVDGAHEVEITDYH